MFLSFIVPAYNVESYIERCIASLCYQDISNDEYEIIIVNDGSTDNTLSKIKNLIQKYAEFKFVLIDKPNGGLSSARNAAMDVATGDYVWFVDSDDYIEQNCLQEIVQYIKRFNELDILLFNTDYIYDNAPVVYNPRRLSAKECFLGSELYLKDFRYPYSGVQFAIYKHSYLKHINLKFKEGVYFEDILYTILLLASNPQCVYVDRVFYHYYMRNSSITNSKSSVKKCLDILAVADELNNSIEQKEKYNNVVLCDQIARLLASIYRYRMGGMSLKDKLHVVKAINSKGYWWKAITESKKYKYIPYVALNFILRIFTFK